MPTVMQEKPTSAVLAKSRVFKKGELLWAAGQSPDHVWAIRAGHASIGIASEEGGNATVQVCNNGSTLCSAAAILGRPYPCSAHASADLVATLVPRREHLRNLERLEPDAFAVVHGLASNLCRTHVQLSQASGPVKNRLAKLLGRLNAQFGGAKLPFGRQELADMIGTCQETVSRMLSPWQRDGVIKGGTNQVTVVQSEVLEAVR